MSRIYTHMYEAVKETERELIEMGIDVHPESMQDKVVKYDTDYDTKELQGYSYIITSGRSLEEDFLKLGGNLEYAQEDFVERITASWVNPGEAWKKRESIWKPFIHNGRFSYTYNERMREQLEFISEELMRNPNTRQAIITIYDRHQDMANMGGKSRIPCSMYYQFMRRVRNQKEVMDIIYTMRSCDIYTHFIYDVFQAMKLQQFMAGRCGIEPGHFTHFIGSLHAYRKDYESKGVF